MSAPKDLYAGLVTEQTVNPATLTGNGDYTEGSVVDGLNAAAVLHALLVGESGDTWSGALKTDMILQHGDESDGSDMAAVTDAADYIGTMETEASGIVKALDAEADDNARYEIVYCGSKRYSRLYLDRTGNHSSGTPMAALAIKAPRLTGDIAPVA